MLVVSMTFDEVGAPAHLSVGPSPATNIRVVQTLLMAIKSTFDLEPEEPLKRYEKKKLAKYFKCYCNSPICKVNVNRL